MHPFDTVTLLNITHFNVEFLDSWPTTRMTFLLNYETPDFISSRKNYESTENHSV